MGEPRRFNEESQGAALLGLPACTTRETSDPCRYVTCALQLDYDTMVGADKFGNISVLRIPKDVSYQIEEDPTGGKFAASGGMLNSAPHKVEAIVNFHAGDLVTSLQLCALQQGGQQVCPSQRCLLCPCVEPIIESPPMLTKASPTSLWHLSSLWFNRPADPFSQILSTF